MAGVSMEKGHRFLRKSTKWVKGLRFRLYEKICLNYLPE
jgi:hypothetical protein